MRNSLPRNPFDVLSDEENPDVLLRVAGETFLYSRTLLTVLIKIRSKYLKIGRTDRETATNDIIGYFEKVAAKVSRTSS